MNKLLWCNCVFVLNFIFLLNALPTSLLENTKTLHSNKVKRTPSTGNLFHSAQLEEAELSNNAPLINNPSAKKRGAETNTNIEWEPEDYYNNNENDYSELNKAKWDQEQLENAIFKSGLYANDESTSPYIRYYTNPSISSFGRRERRNLNFRRLNQRFKREIAGNPDDDLLDLISLWEAERKYNRKPYWRHRFNNYQTDEFDNNNNDDGFLDADVDDSNENWLEAPTSPNAHSTGHLYTKNLYQPNQLFRKHKRFMVSRKRNHDDNLYTLAQLLSGSQQRDPNIPLYRRAVL